MKEIQDFNQDKIEVQIEQQQKKEIKLIGKQRKIPGLTLWEYNTKTFDLDKAKYSKVDLHLKSLSNKPQELESRHKVIANEGCLYFQALNLKNAERKVKKAGLKLKF
jgi:hypothetical protein